MSTQEKKKEIAGKQVADAEQRLEDARKKVPASGPSRRVYARPQATEQSTRQRRIGEGVDDPELSDVAP